MNIFINILSSVSGGGVSYLRNCLPLLYEHFYQSNNQNTLTILAHQSQRQLFPSIPDYNFILLPGIRLTGFKRIVWEHFNINKLVADAGADVLFVPYQTGHNVKNVKQVLLFQNMDPFTFTLYRYNLHTATRKQILKNLSTSSIKKADRVIAISQHVKKAILDTTGIDQQRVATIYHGRDTNFSPLGDEKSDKIFISKYGITTPFILTCGSLWPYRRCEDVIKAYNKICETLGNTYQLVIAGSGIYRPYINLIKDTIHQSPFANQIRLIGHVPQEAMQALYRICSVCVIASEVEACPMIAIEAMTSGCAILSSNCEPMPEMFAGCSQEFLSRNIDDLSHKMITVLENQDIRTQLKEKALERASAFSWEKCAAETYSALVNW